MKTKRMKFGIEKSSKNSSKNSSKKKTPHKAYIIQEILAIFGISIIVLLIINSLLGLGIKMHNYYVDKNYAESAPLYTDKKAAVAMMTEEDERSPLSMYSPYTIWQRKDFKGKYVNYENGVRKTCYNSEEPDTIIWMFGGSTMEGYRSEDDCSTIPSQLAKILNQDNNKRVKIYNFGVGSYYSTQEVISFIERIKRTDLLTDNANKLDKPDIVIFYNGLNEVGSFVSSPYKDYHQDYARIKMRFEQPLLYLLLDSNIGKAVNFVVPKKTIAPMNSEVLNSAVAHHVNVYNTNMFIAKDLCEYHGCRIINILQPSLIMPGKTMTPYEENNLKIVEEQNPDYYNGLDIFYGQLLKSQYPPANFATIFDGYTGDMYLDVGHLTKKGNSIVAKEMSLLILSDNSDTE